MNCYRVFFECVRYSLQIVEGKGQNCLVMTCCFCVRVFGDAHRWKIHNFGCSTTCVRLFATFVLFSVLVLCQETLWKSLRGEVWCHVGHCTVAVVYAVVRNLLCDVARTLMSGHFRHGCTMCV